MLAGRSNPCQKGGPGSHVCVFVGEQLSKRRGQENPVPPATINRPDLSLAGLWGCATARGPV